MFIQDEGPIKFDKWDNNSKNLSYRREFLCLEGVAECVVAAATLSYSFLV